jgi:hypothetical protein
VSETFKTILGHDPINLLRYEAGVILPERDLARVAAALQGITAITTVLTQREVDAECGGGGLTFEPALATGLLMALATCTKYAEGIVDTGGLCGVRAEFGTDAYARLIESRNAIEQGKRKDGQQ